MPKKDRPRGRVKMRHPKVAGGIEVSRRQAKTLAASGWVIDQAGEPAQQRQGAQKNEGS